MQLPRLREKVNACYGYNAIARITLTQTAPTGFAEGQAAFAPAPPMPAPHPAPETLRAAKGAARNVQDDSLRDALETLAAHVLSRAQHTRGPCS